MYPSIDNEVDLAACKEASDRREKLSPSTECLFEAIKITLEFNNSTFNKKTLPSKSRHSNGTTQFL